jgi:hypothetical protein
MALDPNDTRVVLWTSLAEVGQSAAMALARRLTEANDATE